MAVQMTREQYRELYGSDPVLQDRSQIDTKPTPVQMTQDEYNARYNSSTEGSPSDFQQAKADFSQTLESGRQNQSRIASRIDTGEVSKSAGLYQRIGSAFGSAFSLAGDAAIGAGRFALTEKGEERAAGLFSDMGEHIQGYNARFMEQLRDGNEDDQAIAESLDEVGQLYRNDETFRDTVNATGGFMEALTLFPGSKVARPVVDRSRASVTQAGTTAKAQAQSIANSFQTTRTNKIVDKRVGEIFDIENNYAKTRSLNDRDFDTGNASRLRIASTDVLSGAVDNDGLLRTMEKGGAVDQYKALTTEGVEGVVGQILKKEGRTININELKRDMRVAVSSAGFEGADLITALRGVEREMEGLAVRMDAFGNIPLEVLHRAKINAYDGINFNVDNKPTIKLRKTKASVFKEMVEKKSTADIKGINAELANYYKDIERLKNLDGKRVKGGRLGKYFAQTTGTMVGGAAGIVGGGPGAAIGGFLGGEVAQRLQGRAMAGTFGSRTGNKLPDNKVLRNANDLASGKPRVDLTKTDAPVGLPQTVKQTPETRKLERAIQDNVRQQKAAIAKKDYTLVAALKDVYRDLVDRLKDYVENVGVGLSIKSSVTPNQVARKMDIEDVEKARLFIDDPQASLLDENTMRMLEDVGVANADLDTQANFLRDAIMEVDQLVESGKHKLIPKGN